MLALFSDALFWGWSIQQAAIAIVVIAAVVALVYVALRQFGVAIPEWVQRCFWIVVVCLVVIFCIKLVFSM
jgi:hypothetical protein